MSKETEAYKEGYRNGWLDAMQIKPPTTITPIQPTIIPQTPNYQPNIWYSSYAGETV